MQGFLIALLACSVTMSALAICYMALTPLLAKRYSENGRYYAWLVIVIGLIIPFRPQFNHAVFKIDVPGEAAAPIIQTGNGAPVTAVVEPVTIGNALSAPALPSVSWWQVAMAVWMVGIIVFLAYHAIKHYRFAKMTRRWSEGITDEPSLSMLQSLKTELGISKGINLYQCSSAGGPMMIGYMNPQILLPKVDLAQDELRFILKHELVHYRRGDLWYKCLVLVATAMHWFNPIVYLMAKAIDIQCELSCDTEVVSSTDVNTRRRYSETIIGVVKYQSKLKTALSTNFYGGKKGMKKRIFSIMDMNKKKTGRSVICGALIITMGTGFAFAANATANAPQANANSTRATEKVYDKVALYGKYEAYGLAYDKATDNLYFNGELVRYFEDWYPVGDDGSGYAGADYFNGNGTIDVRGIRDLSQITHNPDGSYDPSGKLMGVEPYSQAEFDARNIDELKNPPQPATAVSNGDDAGGADYYGGGSNFILSDESRETFKIYAGFGLTYDEDDVFRYQGKTVRWFADLDGGLSFTRVVENDYDKSVDLTALRGANGNLTGLSAAGRAEFQERTRRIEQSQREWEEFYKNNLHVTAVSDVSYEGGAAYSASQSVPGTDTMAAYATSNNPDYVDTNLDDYISYGITYNKINKTWMFNDRPISFLIDPGHQIYVNFPYDNTAGDFAKTAAASNGGFLKVIRGSGGSIDTIVEMTADEAVKAIKDIFN